jgi:dienelactone hydrolase
MNAEFAAHGQDARNSMQLRLLENEEMNDAISALAVLRAMPEVDSHRVAVVGHSLGFPHLMLAERQPDLRALVIFSGAGYSWDRSAPLRARMTAAVPHIAAPVLFIHAENDFALSAGKAMDAQFAQLHRPHRLQIYPPIGQTVEDGHAFLYLGVTTWGLMSSHSSMSTHKSKGRWVLLSTACSIAGSLHWQSFRFCSP